MPDAKTISVTRLVRKMRNLLEIELGEVWVEGEVSNMRRQASGHLYFTLKDDGAQMSCVMFRGNASRAKVQPDNGMQVKLFGEVSVYEARGSVQLIVRQVESAGEGELQAKFEALKKKLDAEGLFSNELKKPIPSFPRKVGLITSGTGAALQDMLNVLGRRAPWVQPVLYPVQVQGVGAEQGIAHAIDQWSQWQENNLPEVDVLIVGRGGGSLEDLWNFNEEVVARAIAACSIPVVSAVGHEIDFTIADFVADMRAPTPSAAAELVVPDGEDLLRKLQRYGAGMSRVVESEVRRYETQLSGMRRGALSMSVERVLREPMLRLLQAGKDIDDAMVQQLTERVQKLQLMKQRYATLHPENLIDGRLEKVAHKKQLLNNVMANKLERIERQLQRQKSLLRALGPDSAFERGFSVSMTKNGELVRSADQLAKGEVLVTKLRDGEIESEVC
ncbi:exodeoxyribonuclease VII large subunit [Rubritalea spongiae]|uniref:Exodeoxyribonuclease 7 large subunit n=1 Tax=Rubritalea spongiae TaxID=430797 RepID=A0ABW5E884_9BACT